MKKAGIRKYGKTTLIIDISRTDDAILETKTHATVMMAAKKPASEELTAWREPAKEESIVSMSFPKRFSIRPGQSDEWNETG